MCCLEATHALFTQDLIARFKDSAQIEEDFKRISKQLKVKFTGLSGSQIVK